MLFMATLVILAVFVAPVLQKAMERKWGLTFWEADSIAFGLVLLVGAFLPIMGIPFVHLKTGETLTEGSISLTFLVLSMFLLLIGFALVGRRVLKVKITEVSGGANSGHSSEKPANYKHRLRVVSNYGRDERVVSDDPEECEVRAIVDSLDWNGFHQVVLERPNGDWMEVGGSLNPKDGIGAMCSAGRRQYVLAKPLESTDQMVDILVSYLDANASWKENWEWI